MTPLRPQDVVVLLTLLVLREKTALADVARRAGVSTGEVSKSLARSAAAGLFDADTLVPRRTALIEFLVHGVPHAFPAPRGAIVRGVPTSTAAPPLRDQFADGGPAQTPVWPSPAGTARGYTVPPLYRTVPDIAPQTPALYELLALTDALREGRARERGMAEALLRQRLDPIHIVDLRGNGRRTP